MRVIIASWKEYETVVADNPYRDTALRRLLPNLLLLSQCGRSKTSSNSELQPVFSFDQGIWQLEILLQPKRDHGFDVPVFPDWF